MKIVEKKHFEVLDGLRGVAAFCILIFHLLEAVNLANPITNIINHGHLAVDIFFMLSGFVMAYAYDSRFESGMGFLTFIKRRIIRLQPMVVFGCVLGFALFYFGASKISPRIAETSWETLILFTLLGMFMIPVTKAVEIRGWGEMFPVNSTQWTLWFEYIAYILYALFARKLGKKALFVCVLIFSILLFAHSVSTANGSIAGGWKLDLNEMRIGFTRLLFPFFCGMLIFRMGWKIRVKYPMLISSLLFCLFVGLPHFGVEPDYTLNGVYEWVVITFAFPIIIMIGAGAEKSSFISDKICSFLGGVSYPLYLTHYAFVYVYFNFVWQHNLCGWDVFWCGLLTFILAVVTACLSYKYYDIPVRRYLSKRLG